MYLGLHAYIQIHIHMSMHTFANTQIRKHIDTHIYIQHIDTRIYIQHIDTRRYIQYIDTRRYILSYITLTGTLSPLVL